jgi:hypothetical protein
MNAELKSSSYLIAEDAVSIEPEGASLPRAEGLSAIREKGEYWNSMMEEMHGAGCSDAVVGDQFFSLSMWIDATLKGVGRERMDEVCVFEVKDGKIVREQFFYREEAPQ